MKNRNVVYIAHKNRNCITVLVQLIHYTNYHSSTVVTKIGIRGGHGWRNGTTDRQKYQKTAVGMVNISAYHARQRMTLTSSI